jgi:hypothetical protein
MIDDQVKAKSTLRLNNNQSNQQTSKQKRKLNDILNDSIYDLEEKKKIFKYTDDFTLNLPIEMHQELKENQSNNRSFLNSNKKLSLKQPSIKLTSNRTSSCIESSCILIDSLSILYFY